MVNEKKSFWDKQVPIREFIYLCVILGLLTVGACSFFLSDNLKAASHLNFAATMISIVLAVIAIVITLVDVAGQKHNVMQLNESMEVLDTSISDIKNLVEKTSIQYDSVTSLKDELLSRITETEEFRKEVLEQIGNLASSNQGNASLVQEVEKIKETIRTPQTSPLEGWDRFKVTAVLKKDYLSLGEFFTDIYSLLSEKIRPVRIDHYDNYKNGRMITFRLDAPKRFDYNTKELFDTINVKLADRIQITKIVRM